MVLSFRPGNTTARRDEQGAVAVLVAMVAVVLFITAAMVVDLGLARDTERQSQNAADASALAAGNVLYDFDNGCTLAAPCTAAAVAEAKNYALDNFGVALSEWASCTDPTPLALAPGPGNCISFQLASPIKNVRVVIPTEEIDTGLGAVAGVQQIDVSTMARAAVDPNPALPCGLCVLGRSTTHDLQNGDVVVDNGNAHFNGSVDVNANGLVVADGSITVEGTATGGYARYDPDPTTGVPPIEDPLGHLNLPPDMTGLPNRGTTGNPCTLGPGIYQGNRNLRNVTCTLQAGLYVIHGGTWDAAGASSTVIRGTGVTLYFTCTTGSAPRACGAPTETGASLDFSGSGSIQITAPTSGPLKGVAIAYDRRNSADLRFTGNGSGILSGAIYAPSSEMRINGNGCTQPYQSIVVVKSLDLNGDNPCLRVDYDPIWNPQADRGRVWLDQ